MRGKGFVAGFLLGGVRITPAYAGKRSSQRNIFKFFWDHPRLCGEKNDSRLFIRLIKGSPPPMRGKGVPIVIKRLTNGITPAYAGKSRPKATAH